MTDAEDQFSTTIFRSVLFHLTVVGIFAIKAFFIPSQSIDISNAVRVDVVDLPDKIAPETLPAPTAAPAPPQPQTKPAEKANKAEPVLNLDRKKQTQDALKRIKAMQALEKMQENVEGEEKAKTVPQHKGNILSPGTELKGIQRSQFDAYLVQLNRHVKENWQLPEWMARQGLKAQALVMADERGIIVKRTLVKASGNKTFDDYVLDAVDRSNPLPPPPDKFSSILEKQGVILAFPD